MKLIAFLLLLSLGSTSAYRLFYEVPTYWWKVFGAEVNEIEIRRERVGESIFVTYSVDGIPEVDFHAVAPIAYDQGAVEPTYPVRYADSIKKQISMVAYVDSNKQNAVLYPGISIETVIMILISVFAIFLFFT